MLPRDVALRSGLVADQPDPAIEDRFDLVVEATGKADILGTALGLVRPRGTLVLKTTSEAPMRSQNRRWYSSAE